MKARSSANITPKTNLSETGSCLLGYGLPAQKVDFRRLHHYCVTQAYAETKL
jgi:hypothetical protein